ncbi:TonB-dependent siderophore receptor [Pseudoduganella chitinolytica]|uniref:TonB-dependent receptor n=1 Tax=Pseudoduganella chitinolytica TaxID=34070 RepID=A0ABY8BHV0_9BURK|nr:TonB-dependent receptor [Pseudoduganella chitinolytica]WEF34943.1 TonB-dependent receptor [Pseudoduganella chitinolytica]
MKVQSVSVAGSLVAGAVLAMPCVAVLAQEVDVVEVVGRRSAGAYHASEADGAKTSLPLRELPQAVRVMSRQSLDDLGATRVDDALDYVGGVSRQNNFGGMWDNIAIRGLAGDSNTGMALLQNGFAGNRGYHGPRDTANIERIEFLKGPAAALYGASEPGGTLNIVTKRPLWRSAQALEAYAGSDDLYRTTLDATGPLAADVAYRINAAAEKRGSMRDFVTTRRTLLAPALTWRAAPGTTVDYRGEWQRHRGLMDRGIAAVGGRLDALPRSRFLGEPADGDLTVANTTHQLTLEHVLREEGGERWALRAGLAWKEGSILGTATESSAALQPDGRTLRRQRRFRDYESRDIVLQAELAGQARWGGIGHDVLLGVEGYRFRNDQRMLRVLPSTTAPYAIDVLAPVYRTPDQLPQVLPATDTRERQRNEALYLQDALRLGDAWRLLAGVRLDRYEQSLVNRRSGVVTTQTPHAVSPRLGVSYLPSPRWTLFANAGRSFRPNSGTDAAGAALAPEHGRAVEAGAKWESADGRAGATLALFDIDKRDVVTADPANPGYSIVAGAVRSRGLDADLTGQLDRHWRANASLSVIDAEVVRDNVLEVGAGLVNVPRVNGSVLLTYEGVAAGRPFGVGGGVTYSARRPGDSRTQVQVAAGTPVFELPGYTQARLTAWWRVTPRLRVSLDIDNLFDRTFYTSSYQSTWVAPGARRAAVLGLQAKF